MNHTGIGARMARKEDRRFITGSGRYTDDLVRPGMVFAGFARSPHAHARIRNIDTRQAEALPGVHAVLTGEALVQDGIGNLICGWAINSRDGTPMKMGAWRALEPDTVRFAGQAIAVVIADTPELARDGVEKLAIDYETLPVVSDAVAALAADAPQIHPEAQNNLIYDWEIGDSAAVRAAIDAAAHVTRLEIVNNRLAPGAMEPRAALAEYDAAQDHHTLWTTSQNPHVARLVLSAFYNIAPEHKLRVIAPDVGGGFGSKIYVYPEEMVCLWAARKVGRPVKWVADRSESFITDAHGRDHVTSAVMALDEAQRIVALQVETTANFGAYMSLFSSAVPTYLYATLLSGQYAIPAIHCNVKAVYTNTTPVDAYRGAGRPEATFVVERLVETAAREIGMDPAEFRRRNFVRSFPHQTPVIMCYDSGDYEASLDAALKAADYAGFPGRRAAAAQRGKLRGIGLSCYIEACGIAPSQAVGSLGAGVGLWESAEVRVNPAGTVEILTGSHSHGQGHETTFAQVVGERLGVDVDNISIIHGDTDKVQFGMGTYGSRSGAVGISAIVKALDKVEGKVRRIAAHLLEAGEDDIEIANGEVRVAGTDRKLGFADISLAAYTAHNLPEGMEPGLKEGAFYDPVNFTFPAGTHICEVEIDPVTGHTQIVNFVAVDDFGKVINPMIVEGQVHGGLAQGIGQALLENIDYDEAAQLRSGSFMDYCMPRADDLPDFNIGLTETLCPGNPLGIKGCGEAGAIGAPPAVMNAVTDAIGTNELAMPATCEAVWQALARKTKTAA